MVGFLLPERPAMKDQLTKIVKLSMTWMAKHDNKILLSNRGHRFFLIAVVVPGKSKVTPVYNYCQ
jgi:hypothetical protein